MKHQLLVCFVVVCWLLSPTYMQAQAQENVDERAVAVQKLEKTLKILDNAYMNDVDFDQVAEDAIKGVLKKLDPHSVYIPSDEYKKMNEPLLGTFEGIGIQFNIFKDTILVVAVTKDGPSDKAGIKPGDKIITVNQDNLAGIGITNKEVTKRLKGPKETQVNLGIKRRNVPTPLTFTITRARIPVNSIQAAYMASPTIGYIKLSRFSATTVREFKKAVVQLREEGMDDLILDLRSNGGGYLNTAVKLSDEFLPKDRLIVYTEGRSFPKKVYSATMKGDFEKGKLVVLVNEGSASASEILAGAIQDWDRGLIIGRRSFGKGLVQKPYTLPDGSVIRLTIAHYYTPTGRSIQKSYDTGVDEYHKEIKKRQRNGEMVSLENLELPDSLRFETMINHRQVYGGGGILPDIFIPIDTVQRNKYYKSLNKKGVFNTFIFTYLDTYRQILQHQYKTLFDFENGFTVDEKMVHELVALAEQEGIESNPVALELAKPIIKNRIKALVARYLYDTSAYHKILNAAQDEYIKAIEILEGETFGLMNIGEGMDE